MNWTLTDSGQLLLLGLMIIGAYTIGRGIAIEARRKREEGGPCS
jgi:hypothetical protein